MQQLTPADAAALLQPRDSLAIPLGPGQPGELLHALSAREDFEEFRVFGALLLDLYPLFAKPGVELLSGFFGPAERALRAAGHRVSFVPGDFRRFAGMVEDLSPRVMATVVAPPDEEGNYSLSLHAGAFVSALQQCGRDPNRVLIAEVNPNLPRTHGLPPEHPHHLTADEIDVRIDSDRALPTLAETAPSDAERAIAGFVRSYIRDGSTLQTGIGGIPSAVAGLLAEGDGGDYGIHSEMFTTGLMRLHQAGKVSNRKGIFDGFSVCTFALGTEELHEWLDDRDDVRFLPVDLVNDPTLIARNRQMIAINGALELDLHGQVVADTLGGIQFSGIGGHEDFVSGASLAHGDHSMVCLSSTAEVKGTRISRIRRQLSAGSIVTTPRHQLDLVITEFGAAELRGRTVEERRQALIEIAHPDFRAELAG